MNCEMCGFRDNLYICCRCDHYVCCSCLHETETDYFCLDCWFDLHFPEAKQKILDWKYYGF